MQGRNPAASQDTRSFHLRVFGCQMNFYDGELIEEAFRVRGWGRSQTPDGAQVVLFHTCSVREQAEERVHGLLGELRRRKKADPGVVIGVIGCMAEREGQQLFEREPHVDIVCGSRHFPQLPDLVERVLGGEQRICLLGESANPIDSPDRDLSGFAGGHQAHVAVMRGCDLNCTYCIVPKVRGRVVSRPAEDIVAEVQRLVQRGVTEVHLLGQTIDAYGRDLPKAERPDLALLLDLLEEIEGLQRIRLVTLHPSYVDARLIEAMARSSKFMRLLPIPLQSGSDPVLKAMKRGYSLERYRQCVNDLRQAMPDLELVCDWIVGFPGESEQDFALSVTAMEEFGFLQSFVFKYSPRPGTTAFEIEDDVPTAVKAERNQVLLALQRRIARERTPRLVGSQAEVLLEGSSKHDPSLWLGRTRNGHYVVLPEEDGLFSGCEVAVEVHGYNGRELLATRIGAIPSDRRGPLEEFSV